jgi:hypothetical protein
MQPFQYFTREGNVYTKKSQTALYSLLAFLLFGLIAFILYKKPTRGGKVSSLLISAFAIIIALRATGKLKIDVNARTISSQTIFFLSPTEYLFEEFQNFLISKQTFIVTNLCHLKKYIFCRKRLMVTCTMFFPIKKTSLAGTMF